jgi:predicted transcriptional regulator
MKALVKEGLLPSQLIGEPRMIRICLMNGIDGTSMYRAIDFARKQGWIEDGTRPGIMRITNKGLDV